MNLIIGLGNFEDKYLQTRHNAGFMFADHLQQQLSLPEFKNQQKFFSLLTKTSDLSIAKPTTYMNASGKAVAAIVNFYDIPLDQVVIAHDDLDLETGSFKFQFGKGPKVHNGLSSIYQQLGSQEFWHLRIGVDSRQGDRSIPGSSYVLQQISADEKELLTSVFSLAQMELDKEFGLNP